MTPQETFNTLYFAFLLSGNAEDFQQVSDAFVKALDAGIPMEDLQASMDEAHTTAEMLCMMADNVPVTKLD